MKKLNLYDIHGISPQTYEVKMANNLADQKKKNQKSTKKTEEIKKKKKDDAETKQKKKNNRKMESLGLLDEITEEGKEEELKEDTDVSESSDDNMEDKYNPLSKKREGAPQMSKKNMLQSMVEQTALEMGKAMPVMTRGAELEI